MASIQEAEILKLVAIGRQIAKDLAKLKMDQDWEKKLEQWIVPPGPTWTTRELILAFAALKSMSAQVKTLIELKENLQKVGEAVTGR